MFFILTLGMILLRLFFVQNTNLCFQILYEKKCCHLYRHPQLEQTSVIFIAKPQRKQTEILLCFVSYTDFILPFSLMSSELFTSSLTQPYRPIFSFLYCITSIMFNNFNKFKQALFSVVNNLDTPEKINEPNGEPKLPLKYPYNRPHFLQLNVSSCLLIKTNC